LSHLAPPRTGKRGRPRLSGERLPDLKTLAPAATFTPAAVHRYGATTQVHTAVINCLWYGVVGPQQVQVVLLRDGSTQGYDVALVSTDLAATASEVIERYAARWSIEVAIEDAKQTTGVGQARNRLHRAVQPTVPFALAMRTLAIRWYPTPGYQPKTSKTSEHEPRGTATRFNHRSPTCTPHARQAPPRAHHRPISVHHPEPATPEEINILRLAWADIAT